jgi:hypothetical protein
VPASVERSQVQGGGAWVAPQTVDITTLAGGGTADVDVVLVSGDSGDRNALRILDALLDRVLALDLAFTGPVDTSYALVTSPARRCPRSGCRCPSTSRKRNP